MQMVESTNRGPVDFFHFGAAFWGLIIGIIGVVTLAGWIALTGLALVVFALIYFAVRD